MNSMIAKRAMLASFAAMLAHGAVAQTTSGTGGAAMAGHNASTAPASAPTSAPGSGNGVVDRNTGTNAASGDSNQAVATTDANAPQPASGSNSFTKGEARRRLEARGFQKVSGLRKDGHGVWRGTASKDGTQTQVWLDYKGNVGPTTSTAQ